MTLKGIKKMDDKELEELQRFNSFGLRLVRGVEWEVEQRQWLYFLSEIIMISAGISDDEKDQIRSNICQ